MALSTFSRQNSICKALRENGALTVQELSEMFSVSTVTIRKDLRHLADENKLVRQWGRVTVNENTEPSSYDLAKISCCEKDEKLRIANAAVQMVHSGDVVLLGPGSTCCMIGELLSQNPDIIIITNAVSFQPYMQNPKAQVIYLGGEYNPLNGSTIGSLAIATLNRLNIDLFFMGANGVIPESGITSSDFSDSIMIQEMLRRSQQVVLVTDHTKFGKRSVLKLTGLERISHIITDDALAPEYITQLHEMNIPVTLA